jgi:hypothetical protein
VVTRKQGNQDFRLNGNAPGFDLLSFRQWASSDPASNAKRGILAKYIVATALELSEKKALKSSPSPFPSLMWVI